MKTSKRKIEGRRATLTQWGVGYKAWITDEGEGILLYATYQALPCGCRVVGNGTLPNPLTIEQCPTHKTELLEACKATLAGIDHACKNAEWRESQLHTLIPRLTSAIAHADGAPEVHELPTDEELSERTGLNVEDWVQEVGQGNTRRSYSDWLNENAESMKGGAS